MKNFIINFFFFFFQAEDGIRDGTVTGVQTCALPIYRGGQEPTLGAWRLRRFRVACRAARTVRDRLIDVYFHLFLSSGVVFRLLRPVLCQWVLGRCEEAGEVPARRAFVQPLGRKIGVLGTGTDKIAAEAVDDRGADVD